MTRTLAMLVAPLLLLAACGGDAPHAAADPASAGPTDSRHFSVSAEQRARLGQPCERRGRDVADNGWIGLGHGAIVRCRDVGWRAGGDAKRTGAWP